VLESRPTEPGGPGVNRELTTLYLSPHLDDVVLSCPGHLLAQRALGQEVVILTIFSGSTEDHRPQYSRRKQEDRAAGRVLEAAMVHGDLLDAPFRGYRDFESIIFGHPDSPDLNALLEQAVATLRPSLVCSPLGVGGHVDHRLVYEAALSLDHENTLFYEDRPYAFVNEAVALRLGQPLDFGSFASSWRQARYVGTYLPESQWRAVVQRYRSASTVAHYLSPTIRAFPEHEQAIKQAVASYSTQIEDWFGDLAGWEDMTKAYNGQLDSSVYAERYWAPS
jgi:LmbE family N-acetylglucosaminyl deacetylase